MSHKSSIISVKIRNFVVNVFIIIKLNNKSLNKYYVRHLAINVENNYIGAYCVKNLFYVYVIHCIHKPTRVNIKIRICRWSTVLLAIKINNIKR